MEIAVIGAARPWAPLAIGRGLRVVGRAVAGDDTGVLGSAGAELVGDYPEFFERLEFPRIHLLDLPAGAEVDQVIDTAYVTMEPGDVVVDATPSYWADTLRRWRRMRHRSIFYLDLAECGGSLLVAGDGRGVDLARPVLERLAGKDRLVVAGEAGAAHYAAMVRDGVATVLGQAMGEAQQLLEAYPGSLDSAALLPLLGPQPAGGGRAGWILDDALQLHAAVPAMAQAVMLRLAEDLDAQELSAPPQRQGPFVRPDDLG
mgnify:CR=1 FL=1